MLIQFHVVPARPLILFSKSVKYIHRIRLLSIRLIYGRQFRPLLGPLIASVSSRPAPGHSEEHVIRKRLPAGVIGKVAKIIET